MATVILPGQWNYGRFFSNRLIMADPFKGFFYSLNGSAEGRGFSDPLEPNG
jgi:hypothetical protein